MRNLVLSIALFIFYSCQSTSIVNSCKQNQISFSGKRLNIVQIDAEQTAGTYKMAVLMDRKLLQLRFSDKEKSAFLMDAESTPWLSGSDLVLEYEVYDGKLRLSASGTLEREADEQTFEVCVTDIAVPEINRIEE